MTAPQKTTDSDLATKAFSAFVKPQKRPVSPADLEALKRATPHTFTYRGLKLNAWSWGEGPAVLLLHGWESRASHMTAFVAPLVAAGFRAIALDAPAHGDSEGEITEVMDYGKAIVAAAAHLGPFTAVIAHSVGSAASLYAYAHGVKVDVSVQVSGPSSLTRVVRRMGQMFNMTPIEATRFQSLIEQHIGAPLSAMDIPALESGMTHPALVIHGMQDRVIKADESKGLVEKWSNAKLLLFSDIGHSKILQDPEVVRASVDFIRDTVAQ